ncbi:hypothetical protein EB093_08095 [bacterium]|nr:hypothetical protein [bacterium]
MVAAKHIATSTLRDYVALIRSERSTAAQVAQSTLVSLHSNQTSPIGFKSDDYDRDAPVRVAKFLDSEAIAIDGELRRLVTSSPTDAEILQFTERVTTMLEAITALAAPDLGNQFHFLVGEGRGYLHEAVDSGFETRDNGINSTLAASVTDCNTQMMTQHEMYFQAVLGCLKLRFGDRKPPGIGQPAIEGILDRSDNIHFNLMDGIVTRSPEIAYFAEYKDCILHGLMDYTDHELDALANHPPSGELSDLWQRIIEEMQSLKGESTGWATFRETVTKRPPLNVPETVTKLLDLGRARNGASESFGHIAISEHKPFCNRPIDGVTFGDTGMQRPPVGYTAGNLRTPLRTPRQLDMKSLHGVSDSESDSDIDEIKKSHRKFLVAGANFDEVLDSLERDFMDIERKIAPIECETPIVNGDSPPSGSTLSAQPPVTTNASSGKSNRASSSSDWDFKSWFDQIETDFQVQMDQILTPKQKLGGVHLDSTVEARPILNTSTASPSVVRAFFTSPLSPSVGDTV